MNLKTLLSISAFIIIISISNAQDKKVFSGKYGGPFSTLTYNKHGLSLTFGGAGVFYYKNNFTAGIFGQVMTSIIEKKSERIQYEDYNLKSRFTGVILGYFQEIENKPKFYISYYTKIGFGKAYLDNSSSTKTIYDSAILISPHIEPVFTVSSFLKIGVGIFYDIYTGVSFLDYSNKDFNAIGLNINFRFVGS